KTELIRQQGPWRSLEAVELATLAWVDWSNHRRLFEPLGNVPPAAKEFEYYRSIQSAVAALLKPKSRRDARGGSAGQRNHHWRRCMSRPASELRRRQRASGTN